MRSSWFLVSFSVSCQLLDLSACLLSFFVFFDICKTGPKSLGSKFSYNSAFLASITMNPVVVCILLLEWTTVVVTTFGLFLFGEGDFKFLGVGSAEVGGGDGEEVEGRGHEGGAEYLPPRRLFFLISS